MDGDGFRREYANEASQKDKKPVISVSFPPSKTIDDFLFPNNIGTLERKAFFGKSVALTPANLGYLALPALAIIDSQLSPRHLIYKPLEFPARIYSGYATDQHISPFYQAEQIYELSVEAAPYQPRAQDAKPYLLPLLRPQDISIAQAYADVNFTPKYDMPKQAIQALSDNFWQASSFFMGRYKVRTANIPLWNGNQPFIYKLDNQFRQLDAPAQQAPYHLSKPIVLGQNQTNNLELILERDPKPKIPFATAYPINIPFIKPPRHSETKGIDTAIQLGLMGIKTDKSYTQEQPTYYAPKKFVDTGSSNFWMTSSYFKEEYKREPQKKTERETASSNIVYRKNQRDDAGKKAKKPPREKEQPQSSQPESAKNSERADAPGYSKKTASKYVKQAHDFAEHYGNVKNVYSKIKGKISLNLNSKPYAQNPKPDPVILPNLGTIINKEDNEEFLEFHKLRKDLEYKTGAKFAYVVMDGLTGEILEGMNANESVSAGSLPKIFITKFILELSQQGKINLDDVLQLRNSQRPKNYKPLEKPMTIKEGLSEMNSNRYGNSNWIATALMEALGIKRIEKMLKQEGYHETVIGDYFRPRDLYREKVKTSARDASRALFEMTNGKGLDENHHKIALEVLNAQGIAYAICNPNNPEGIDTANILGKHGQSERDISTGYSIKGTRNGKYFNRVVVLIESGINKAIVKSDFKTPAPGGVETMMGYFNANRLLCKVAQSIGYKPA